MEGGRRIVFAIICFHRFDEEGGVGVGTGPGNLLTMVVHATDATAHDVVVGTVDHRLGVVHQFEFLHALLFHRTEVLLMGSPQTGEYTDGGRDDVAQGRHLTGLTDACLEDAHLGLFVQQPYGEGNAYLGVVAAGRAHNLLRGQEQLVEPLLDHRLTVGTRDADDGDVELIAMTLCQTLESGHGRRDYQEIGILELRIEN